MTRREILTKALSVTAVGVFNRLDTAVIVLDPGHGGNAKIDGSSPNNATGPRGTKEKDLTLRIVVKIAEILNQQGYKLFLTRNSDTNLGLSNRAKVAFSNNALVFVSIHFNGNTDTSVQGTETWVHPASTSDSRLLAASIQQRLISVTGYTDRGLKSNDFGVLNPGIHTITTAACLTEISFLTNPADEERLKSDDYISQLATAISIGIKDYLNHSTSIPVITPTPFPFPTRNSDG